jgi:hypothetical protein
VTSSGNTSYLHKLIQVGKRWAGATVRIVAVGELVHIYHGDVLARILALDPDSSEITWGLVTTWRWGRWRTSPRNAVRRLRPLTACSMQLHPGQPAKSGNLS